MALHTCSIKNKIKKNLNKSFVLLLQHQRNIYEPVEKDTTTRVTNNNIGYINVNTLFLSFTPGSLTTKKKYNSWVLHSKRKDIVSKDWPGCGISEHKYRTKEKFFASLINNLYLKQIFFLTVPFLYSVVLPRIIERPIKQNSFGKYSRRNKRIQLSERVIYIQKSLCDNDFISI